MSYFMEWGKGDENSERGRDTFVPDKKRVHGYSRIQVLSANEKLTHKPEKKDRQK